MSKFKEIKVLFFTVPLSEPLKNVSSILLNDPDLHTAIQEYSKYLMEEDNIETFAIDRNMIVTDAGYKIVVYENKTKNKMQSHIQRMIEEKDLLEDKVTKLSSFIGGEIYSKLPKIEQSLLKEQFYHMHKYLEVLKQRIG